MAAAFGLPREVGFLYQGGLVDYVAHLNRGRDAAHHSIVAFEADEGTADLRRPPSATEEVRQTFCGT